MPTIFKIGPYRFFFYSSDRDEPIHVHVERENCTAKIWMDPIRLQNSGGFNRGEINRILSLVSDHQTEITEAWHEYFSN
jgi:hypothetical protein